MCLFQFWSPRRGPSPVSAVSRQPSLGLLGEDDEGARHHLGPVELELATAVKAKWVAWTQINSGLTAYCTSHWRVQRLLFLVMLSRVDGSRELTELNNIKLRHFVCKCFACLYVYALCGTYLVPKRPEEGAGLPWKRELETVVSFYVGAGNRTPVL